jgi:hypothetical protein
VLVAPEQRGQQCQGLQQQRRAEGVVPARLARDRRIHTPPEVAAPARRPRLPPFPVAEEAAAAAPRRQAQRRRRRRQQGSRELPALQQASALRQLPLQQDQQQGRGQVPNEAAAGVGLAELLFQRGVVEAHRCVGSAHDGGGAPHRGWRDVPHYDWVDVWNQRHMRGGALCGGPVE